MYAQRVPQRLDFFRAESLDFEEAQNIGREFVGEMVVVFEPPVPHEGCNFFRCRLAEPVHRLEPVFLDKLFERFGEGLQRARGMRVGADFERVLAFQFEQPRDVFEHCDDVVFAHKKVEPLIFTKCH